MYKVYVLIGLLLVNVSFAEEFNVPSDYSTIQAGIDAASSGDTVSVAAGTYVESITMKSGVSIVGAGADVCTIDGDNDDTNYDSIVTCSDCSAGTRLEGFTITNDYANFGGMFNYNSSVEVVNCTFSSNTGVYGGGMCNWGSSLTISNCTFSSNTAGCTGGGIYNYDVTAQVNNCTFTSNSSASNGAAVYNSSDLPATSYVYLTRCTFTENTSQDSDDYVIYSALSSTLTLTNCTLYRNLPKAIYYNYIDGGGNSFDETIYVDVDGLAPYESIQDAIDAAADGDTIMVMPGRYYENLDMSGKAITLQSSDPTAPEVIASTILDGNAAGSVITCDSDEGSDTVIAGFIITNGYAEYGSGMFNQYSDPTVSNCTFSGNTATECGGGMFTGGSSSTISNCSFCGNTATEYGGGIYNGNSSPIITNCTFSGNTADRGGGGISNMLRSPSIISNCTFSGNTASKYGGGVYNYNYSFPTIGNCTFSGNTADDGGGICNHTISAPTVSNCIFSGNTADRGGGMYSPSGCGSKISDSSFCLNSPNAIEGNYTDNDGNSFDYCMSLTIHTTTVTGDLDGDGDVDMIDFAAFAENWLTGVE